MKYKVTHTTKYTYSEAVRVCHNRVMLTPKSDVRSKCHSHRLVVRPTPQVSHRRTDYFGNVVQTFSIEAEHRQLMITSNSRVEVEPAPTIDPSGAPTWTEMRRRLSDRVDLHWLDVCLFQFNSPRITRSELFRKYAQTSFPKDRPILEAALDLNSRIHRDFQYDTDATNVATSTENAFEIRRGVCQDFAHVELACLRSLGLPARYVSGYLRTHPPPGKERRAGADESHAWVAVYCGQEIGWVDLDPTNDALCSTDHVPVAVGRDYTDVTPIKGVFLGGGAHALTVSVDVLPQDTAASP